MTFEDILKGTGDRPNFDLTLLDPDNVELPRDLLARERWRMAGLTDLSRSAYETSPETVTHGLSYDLAVLANTPDDLPWLLRRVRYAEIQVNQLTEPELLAQMTEEAYFLMLGVYGLDVGASYSEIIDAKRERDLYRLTLQLAAQLAGGIAKGIELTLAKRLEAEQAGVEFRPGSALGDPGLNAGEL